MTATITNPTTGLSMGRMSLTAPLGWVEPQFAACFSTEEEAIAAATFAFGYRVALIEATVTYI